MYIVAALLIGIVLDLIIGDPNTSFHIIVIYGKIISFMEHALNKGSNLKKKIAGICTAVSLITLMFFSFSIIEMGIHILSQQFSNNLLVFILSIFQRIYISAFLSFRTLVIEVYLVARVTRQKGLDAGRKQVSRIVGRDTRYLTEDEVYTASIETLAENLSDGVIAPMFWYLLGGIPAMATYKMINTLDSMIGYKTERYRYFGWCSAHIDDIVNYIPARLTGLCIALCGNPLKGIRSMQKFGRAHASPNSGYPEAAMAGVLSCRFGGPHMYHGEMIDKPFIGDGKTICGPDQIRKAIRVTISVYLLLITIGVIIICI